MYCSSVAFSRQQNKTEEEPLEKAFWRLNLLETNEYQQTNKSYLTDGLYQHLEFWASLSTFETRYQEQLNCNVFNLAMTKSPDYKHRHNQSDFDLIRTICAVVKMC